MKQRPALRAFHNDPGIQAKYINRVERHYKHDQIAKGFYVDRSAWGKPTKYCAVGCVIHSGNHHQYETLLGIPEELAQFQDQIFEMLWIEDAKEWARNFLTVIPLGADLIRPTHLFIAYLLRNIATEWPPKNIFGRLAALIEADERSGENYQTFMSDFCEMLYDNSNHAHSAYIAFRIWNGADEVQDVNILIEASGPPGFIGRTDGGIRTVDRQDFALEAASVMLTLLADAPVPSVRRVR